MTYSELELVRPYTQLLLGARKFHVTEIHFDSWLRLRVVADYDWPAFEAHFRIKQPAQDFGYRTEAEVDKIPMPEIRDWDFDLSGHAEKTLESSKRKLALLELVA